MKKLSLILFLAAVIFGVYGCGEEPESRDIPANSHKLEMLGDKDLLLYSIYYNDYDNNYYLLGYDSVNDKYNVYKSENEGEDFDLCLTLDADIYGNRQVRPDIVVGKGGYVFLSTSGVLYRYSPDLSEKVDLIETGKSAEGLESPYFNLRGGRGLIAVDSDGILYKDLYYRSTDNGLTWILAADYKDDKEENKDDDWVASSPQLLIKNNILVYYSRSIQPSFKISTDQGYSWSKVFLVSSSIDSLHCAFYDIHNITSADPKPYIIKKHAKGDTKVIGIDKYGKVLSEKLGSHADFDYKFYDPKYTYIYASSDMGETWDYQFYLFEYQRFFTPSGHLYFETWEQGILRNITPLK